MSKPSSGLFKETAGTRRIRQSQTSQVRETASAARSERITPDTIRFSQSSVNGSADIVESMRRDGWKGDPIDVVVMDDGQMTTLDNTRVVAARAAGIEVVANVHGYDDPLPDQGTKERFATRKGGVPETWGQAVENRIGKQSSVFRHDNPRGSYDMDRIG